jgi:hypothetical protein
MEPVKVEANIKALGTRAADSPALARYNEVACMLTQNANARAEDGIDWIKNLCQTLQVQSLSHLGLKKADFPAVIAGGIMKFAPNEGNLGRK